MILQLLNLNDVSSLRDMCICVLPKKSYLKFQCSYTDFFFYILLKFMYTPKSSYMFHMTFRERDLKTLSLCLNMKRK